MVGNKEQFIIGCVDSAYGYMFLWDNEKWHHSADGQMVSSNNAVFLADYYGYPDGAIYIRLANPV